MALPAYELDHSVGYAQRVSDAVAAEVRAAMGRRRANQTQLARSLAMSQPALSRRLSGEVAFDVVELARIADALGIRASELIPDLAQGTGRYQPYPQVRAALDLVHYVGPDQLTLDDAPRYDRSGERHLATV